MTTVSRIEAALRASLAPTALTIDDESHLHVGHVGAAGGGGHYRVRIVAEAFRGRSLVERHRMVYAALGALMGGTLHALALSTAAPDE